MHNSGIISSLRDARMGGARIARAIRDASIVGLAIFVLTRITALSADGVSFRGSIRRSVARGKRIHGGLLVIGALLLFVAGLLLLFGPTRVQDQSGPGAHHFPDEASGWIMGSQSHEPVSVAGG